MPKARKFCSELHEDSPSVPGFIGVYEFSSKSGRRFRSVYGKNQKSKKHIVPGFFDSCIEAALAHDEYIIRNKDDLNHNFECNFIEIDAFSRNALKFSDDNDKLRQRQQQAQLLATFKKCKEQVSEKATFPKNISPQLSIKMPEILLSLEAMSAIASISSDSTSDTGSSKSSQEIFHCDSDSSLKPILKSTWWWDSIGIKNTFVVKSSY